jgi:hypothetical protein
MVPRPTNATRIQVLLPACDARDLALFHASGLKTILAAAVFPSSMALKPAGPSARLHCPIQFSMPNWKTARAATTSSKSLGA